MGRIPQVQAAMIRRSALPAVLAVLIALLVGCQSNTRPPLPYVGNEVAPGAVAPAAVHHFVGAAHFAHDLSRHRVVLNHLLGVLLFLLGFGHRAFAVFVVALDVALGIGGDLLASLGVLHGLGQFGLGLEERRVDRLRVAGVPFFGTLSCHSATVEVATIRIDSHRSRASL